MAISAAVGGTPGAIKPSAEAAGFSLLWAMYMLEPRRCRKTN
jgi:hypothetical protein